MSNRHGNFRYELRLCVYAYVFEKMALNFLKPCVVRELKNAYILQKQEMHNFRADFNARF